MMVETKLIDTRVISRVVRKIAVNSETQASKAETKQLRPNPFTTYRDPETGRWMVIKNVA